MVGIVKWLRPRVVAPVYVGSNPTTHPILSLIGMRRIFRLWQGAEGARSGMYDGT